MNATDIVIANVVGTNGKTRNQRVVSARFRGDGVAIDTEGKPTGAPGLDLAGIGGAQVAPDFPHEEYREAQKKGKEAVNAVMLAHAERIEQWEKAQGGGTLELQLAKAVQAYCINNEGFLSEDGDGFVLKLENLDVKSDKLPDGRNLFLVQGTAVFGTEGELLALARALAAAFLS